MFGMRCPLRKNACASFPVALQPPLDRHPEGWKLSGISGTLCTGDRKNLQGNTRDHTRQAGTTVTLTAYHIIPR